SEASALSKRYEAARQLAHQVPRILLLSATPALHREHDLLAMLHLLDPDTYPLEDLEAFEKRVQGREQIGELLLALRPGAPEFLGGCDSRRRVVDEWLERWRTTLIADARERGGADALESAAKAFNPYVACATGDLEALRDLAKFRLTWSRAFRETAGLTPEES